MSFATYEESTESGRPIQLYRFSLGANVWRYHSGDEDIEVAGAMWKRAPISDDGIRQTGEASSDALNIDCPDWVGPAAVYATSPPDTAIVAEVLALHEGVTVPQIIYIGEVAQVNFPKPGAARITCQTLTATMRRQGLRLGFQRTCPFALYDTLTCRVPKNEFAVPVAIESVEGFAVTSQVFAGSPDGYFSGGFVEWSHPMRGAQRIMIESHVGASVQMFDATSELHPGLAVTAYPGCARTMAACEKFNNWQNYGGFPAMPGKSPFDGTPVF